MGESITDKIAADHLAVPVQEASFQDRVRPWMLECFGAVISADAQERNHRFLEEALELVQACGATQSEAHQLVDYVFGRPVGEPNQEVGGVMITLAALCHAQRLNMHAAGEVELSRIWTKVAQIRAKQAAKPKHSPLPAAVPAETPAQAEQDSWTRVTTELPPFDEGLRVLVYTEGVDFAGEQYFDIPADHLHYAASGDELGQASEVAEAVSHWKRRPHD